MSGNKVVEPGSEGRFLRAGFTVEALDLESEISEKMIREIKEEIDATILKDLSDDIMGDNIFDKCLYQTVDSLIKSGLVVEVS